jgi:hypothetical protein
VVNCRHNRIARLGSGRVGIEAGFRESGIS